MDYILNVAYVIFILIPNLFLMLLFCGLTVAHTIYGVAQTINSANYMYFQSLEKVLSLNHPQCIHAFTGK